MLLLKQNNLFAVVIFSIQTEFMNTFEPFWTNAVYCYNEDAKTGKYLN